MMKYLLILILSLLPLGMKQGFASGPGSMDLSSLSAIQSEVQDSIHYLGSVKDDFIKKALLNAYVADPKDSFPLQVGAFKYKSNAEKISLGIKNLSGQKVKIYTEDGLYKVRIARLPSIIKSKGALLSESVNDDIVRTALINDYVASPENAFPLQVGAFRYKSNAEKISQGMQSLAGMEVKIYFKDGLYKVRIIRMPSPVKNEESVTAESIPSEPSNNTMNTNDTEGKILLAQMTPTASDTIMDPKTSITRAQSETSDVTGDPNPTLSQMTLLKGYSPWLKRIKYFGESYILVKALIITILICIGTMITLLIIILLNRRRMENESRLRQYLMEKYQSLIVDYLYGSATPEEFRIIASDNYSRQVLIEQMIDVSVNLKGEESKKLLNLYKHLGLDRDSLARARDYRWHKKVKGFRELAFMNIKSANDAIIKALNSSNEILRMEAQIALVRLSDDNHFDFLFHLKRPFSLWEQITLHDLIIQHNIPVPAFKKWLESSNDTVVLFALRMIREFKQLEAEEDIKKALQHNSQSVRLLAVQVAGDLQLSSTLEIMKRMYKIQDYRTCLEIVRSMGKMPKLSMMGFLKLVLDKEDDVQLQIEATKSIEKMGDEGVKALVKIMKSEYKNYNIIVRHVLDRRIN